jgi:hypothetical protein
MAVPLVEVSWRAAASGWRNGRQIPAEAIDSTRKKTA